MCIGKKADVVGFNFNWNKVDTLVVSCNRIKCVVASESVSKLNVYVLMKVKFHAFWWNKVKSDWLPTLKKFLKVCQPTPKFWQIIGKSWYISSKLGQRKSKNKRSHISWKKHKSTKTSEPKPRIFAYRSILASGNIKI